MRKNEWRNITVELAKESLGGESYIGNDLLLFDNFGDVALPSVPRRMQCLLVALCTEGQASYTIDAKEHVVKANDVIVVGEGQVVESCSLSDDCRGVAMLSSNDFLHEIIKEVHEMSSLFLFAHANPVFSLTEEKKEMFVKYFNEIREKVNERQHHFRKELVTTILKALIYELGNEIWLVQQGDERKNSRAETIFTNFVRLVEQNFRHERRVGWYAERLCITPKYLSETIKLVSKRPPNEWIDNYVTLEIRVLLKNSTKSIKEIAQELNFPSQSFLGKYFKEHVGMSPSKYRKA